MTLYNHDSKKKRTFRQTNDELFDQFKKNLRELFSDKLDVNSIERMLDDLKDIIPDTPINPLWQEHIDSCFGKWIAAVHDPRLIPIVIDNWSWMKNPNNTVWEGINIIARFGAGSVKQLIDKYSIVLQDKGIQRPIGKKRAALKERVREALKYLVSCGIIGKKTLEEEELGHARFTVDIYYAPENLRIPSSLEDAIQSYIVCGGRSTGKKPRETPLEEKTTKREKKMEKSIEKQIIDDKNTHYACTHCRTSKKVSRQSFTGYQKTNNDKVLINALYGKHQDYEFTKIEREAFFQPCSCLNNKWIRITHYGNYDTHKEILTLENSRTGKAMMVVEKISNEDLIEFIKSIKFGNPVLASGLKFIEASNEEIKEN